MSRKPGARSLEEIQADADRHFAELRRQHKIRVKDLRLVAAILPKGHKTLKALEEKAPEYVCTCGESFDTLEEANHHLKEVKD